jgi:uncharacterized protein (TIGR00299 family) protein
MKILYLDCYSGISGDMFLGSMIDAGLDLARLKSELAKLNIKGYRLTARRVVRSGIGATKFDVEVLDKRLNREKKLKEILAIIDSSKLDKDIKEAAAKIFNSLAKAEARVHGMAVESVHFHEVGDMDSIIDIVGAVIALRLMGIERVYSSRVSIGREAMVKTRSGFLPVPAPATLDLLKKIPIASPGIARELVTPTGAAILANLVDKFAPAPEMVLSAAGYGAGKCELKGHPNCLRVMVGETAAAALDRDSIYILEANIDDMTPIDYEFLMDRLFKAGALDAYLTPVQMKKTRPGILLTVLTKKELLDNLSSVIFAESTTIGIRYYEVERKKLKREFARVKTRFGRIKVKISKGPDGRKKVVPEYEDCKRAADKKNIPLAQIRREVDRLISKI